MRCLASAIGILLAAGGVAAADTNHCEINVTGDATASVKADAEAGPQQGKLAAVTDYWMSDAELRTAVGITLSFGSKDTPAEHQRKLDEAMKKQPRFMLLVINCLADTGGIIFAPAAESNYADVAMKPASYEIAAGDATRAGQFNAMFHVGGGAVKRESFRLSEPGKLTLTQFDTKGLAGNFSFKAETRDKTPKHVTVTGSFRYVCRGGNCQK